MGHDRARVTATKSAGPDQPAPLFPWLDSVGLRWRGGVSGDFTEIQIRQPPLAGCPVTKLALRLVALKLAKSIFGRNVSDYLAF